MHEQARPLWRIGWIHTQDDFWTASSYRFDPVESVIVERTVPWSGPQGAQTAAEISGLIRVAKELGEEVDALVLGQGVEEAAEVIRELVHIPVICVSIAPLIVGQVYGKRIGMVKEEKGSVDIYTFAHSRVEAIALAVKHGLPEDHFLAEHTPGIPVIDGVEASLLLAELAAKLACRKRNK